MLRYDKFSCGIASVVEFGTASKLEDFNFLIKFSPLQNIRISLDADKQVGTQPFILNAFK